MHVTRVSRFLSPVKLPAHSANYFSCLIGAIMIWYWLFFMILSHFYGDADIWYIRLPTASGRLTASESSHTTISLILTAFTTYQMPLPFVTACRIYGDFRRVEPLDTLPDIYYTAHRWRWALTTASVSAFIWPLCTSNDSSLNAAVDELLKPFYRYALDAYPDMVNTAPR